MALRLKLRKKPLHPSFFGRSSSSSSSAPLPGASPPSNSDEPSLPDSPQSTNPKPSPPTVSSYFSDILQSSPTPTRRIPTSPPPPPPVSSKPSSSISLEEVRRSLASFRRAKPSSDSSISFQDLFKNNAISNPNADVNRNANPLNFCPGSGDKGNFDSIRESLRQHGTGASLTRRRDERFSLKSIKWDGPKAPSSMPFLQSGPDAVFGKELREKADGEKKVLRSDFVKMYSPQELGEKLRKLRPEGAGKDGKGWFSLAELNQRLVKLREMEEKETESRLGGSWGELRRSLMKQTNDNESRKAADSMSNMWVLLNIGGKPTQPYTMSPPQEELLERYFHPDHMSAAEKMKLELQQVRDEFKMSENDCGSARVQVAQLTTKIKYLSATLHKKDKHSRKGLQEMVQRRKKYLKYLRRTDWDSYCLVLLKLGLRDVPEYKAPDYKSKSKAKSKSKSKSKSKAKSKMKA